MARKTYRFEIVTRVAVKAPNKAAALMAAREAAMDIGPGMHPENFDCDAKLEAGRSTVRQPPQRRPA